MHVRERLGRNLRQLRVDKQLSQERLGLEAGIDRSYVGRVERGLENVTLDTMLAFATALEVDVSALLAEIDPNTPMPAALPSGRKPKVKR
jgi:transcriptional regulator with XRE-family HTH domain